MASGLAQLCIVIVVVLATAQQCLSKEINSTKDLTKEETSGFNLPWQYDADSGSKSKSQSSSSSKSFGEGSGKGTGYGGSVKKDKPVYGVPEEESSGSGYDGGHEGHSTSGPVRKGKVHVFNLAGPGSGHSPNYGSHSPNYGSHSPNYGSHSQYSKPRPYGNSESSYGHGHGHGSSYQPKEGSGYSSESYDKSGESEQHHDRPGYSSASHSSSSGGGGGRGYSPQRSYTKPASHSYTRFHNFGGGGSASSESPGYPQIQSYIRKPQYQARNQEVQEKINEQLSVFIRQLGNLPLPRFPTSEQKKNGEREGYLLLPVLPNEKQHGGRDHKEPESQQRENDKSESSTNEGQHSNSASYSAEEQSKDSGDSSYPSGYGINQGLVPSFEDTKQSNYPESQEAPYSYSGASGPSQNVGKYTGVGGAKKYLVTFEKSSDDEGGASYGGMYKSPVLYSNIPSEGNTGKYIRQYEKVNPYEHKMFKEARPYALPQQTEEVGPVKNNYYDNGKSFDIKPYGQNFFIVPEHGAAPTAGKDYGIGGQHHALRAEPTAPHKPSEAPENYGTKYVPNSHPQKPISHPLAFTRPQLYDFTNVRVKNPNANLFRHEKIPNQYLEHQNIPDIGFDIGGDYASQLGAPEQAKQVINHGPMEVSVMYKNKGHGLEGYGAGLPLVQNFMAGHRNLNALGPNFGYHHPASKLFTHADAVQIRQAGGLPHLYNRPSRKTKSIALFLNKPDQLRHPGGFSPVMGGGLANRYKSAITNIHPGLNGKYRHNLMPFELYSGLHGLGSSLSPIVHTDLINMY